MDKNEAQRSWDEYHQRIKNRRLAEAVEINTQLNKSGVTVETDLTLDFNFFTKDKEGAEGIRRQLSENYAMTISQDGEQLLIHGTTKPHTINLTPGQHQDWVEFMHDVAISYGCIFSTWVITEPSSKNKWSNENIETKFD